MRRDNELTALADQLVDAREQRQLALRRQRGLGLVHDVQAVGPEPLSAGVTFFVGENGSGKSTLIEAIAVKAGFQEEGGSLNFGGSRRPGESELHQHIRLVRGAGRQRSGFFLRAETMFNVATAAEALGAYGMENLHVMSHGEAFLNVAMDHAAGGRSVARHPARARTRRSPTHAWVRSPCCARGTSNSHMGSGCGHPSREVACTAPYAAATIRAVARDARVDPALVMHFFGSKEGLLFAVLEELSDFAETMLASLAGPRAGRGRRFTRAYFEAWEAPVMGSQLRTLVRAAIGSPRASRAFQEHLAASLARSGIAVSQHAGLMLAASQLFGIAVVRYIIEVPVLVALSIDELVQRLGPTIDKYLRAAE